jgi:alginate production protein
LGITMRPHLVSHHSARRVAGSARALAWLGGSAAAIAALALGGWVDARAQFTLPANAKPDAAGGFTLPEQAPVRLSYQYAYGMESPFTYRRHNDLDSGLRDNFLAFKTKVFGSIVYRPTDWLTTTLEMKLGREYPIQEELQIQLPNGDVKVTQGREPTLLVEQLLLTVRNVIAPFEINLGRRNYEDDRHWVFDGSIDVASLSYRHENVRGELMVGRDLLWSLDALRKIKKPLTEMAMLYADYRGFDNNVLAAYVMKRRDPLGQEGAPVNWSLRASGKPSATFSYWLEAALQRGKDENGQKFKASAFDVGGTYRFADWPFDPNVTLSYAYGSGDGSPDDGINQEFRQTGLQTNEAKYIGLSKFKAYGEMLDSELSNMKIVTLGLGARLQPGISVDMIYHRYRLDALASEIRNWGLTAQMNTLPGSATKPQSKEMGQEVDLVIGFRGLFDIRRLGLDLRIGRFFPGAAFRRADPINPNNPQGQGANKGLSVIAKFRY